MSAAVRLQVTCHCGHGGTMGVTANRPGRWTCPECHSSWQPDPDSAGRAVALARGLGRVRLLAVGVPVAMGVLAGLLAIWRPSLIMTVPLAIGLAMVVLRRAYRNRLLSIYRQPSLFTLVRVLS